MTAAVPPTAIAPAAPAPEGAAVAQFARLVRWELLLAWKRRAMVITLSSILLVGYVLVVLIQLITYTAIYNEEGGRAAPDSLIFPGTVGVSAGYVSYFGLLLFVALTGALIGSEYSYSTLRLSFTRGVGRGQLLAAQIVAIALMALGLCATFVLIGVVTGSLNSLLGIPSPAGSTVTGEGVLEVLVYWLTISFNLFCYALISVCIGTLSRSVAGAIAGPLVYLVVEVIAGNILTALGDSPFSPASLRMLGELPTYFLGNNTNALEYFAGHAPYVFNPTTPRFDLAHALIVCLVYVVVLIGLSYLALRRRDIVE